MTLLGIGCIIGGVCFRHWWVAIVGWILIMVAGEQK
jgi:hypothetical protein